jgi:hypothetical protein
MKHDPTCDPIYIEPTTRSKSRDTRAIYQCGYCQTKFTAIVSKVYSGKIRSCGCLRRTRRADHTKRQLNSWGAAKTAWVGSRFLSHTKLQPRKRAEADCKLMKSLNIKDKDILFKAALVAQKRLVLPTHPEVVVNKTEPVKQAGLVLPAFGTPVKQPSVEIPQQPIINVAAGGTVNIYQHREVLERDIPYDRTDAGFQALTFYWQENQKSPPDGFDLKAWAQMKRAN